MNTKVIIAILIIGGAFSIGTAYATFVTNGDGIMVGNGRPLFFVDNSTSIVRTDGAGSSPGNFLTERGTSGIVFRIGGSPTFGSGTQVMRIDNNGVGLMAGKTIFILDPNVNINRTDTTGTVSGNLMNLKGFSGFIFTTTSGQKVRITQGGFVGIGTNTPTQLLDVRGNIATTGNLTATPTNEFAIKTTNNKDICIGNGC